MGDSSVQRSMCFVLANVLRVMLVFSPTEVEENRRISPGGIVVWLWIWMERDEVEDVNR